MALSAAIDAAAVEVAFQKITELEARVAALEAGTAIDYGAAHNSNEECVAHTCSYFTGYLIYGPDDLTHEGYHAAEKCFEAHSAACAHNWDKGPCPRHIEWEKKVRA
jgi:hypothetical protein